MFLLQSPLRIASSLNRRVARYALARVLDGYLEDPPRLDDIVLQLSNGFAELHNVRVSPSAIEPYIPQNINVEKCEIGSVRVSVDWKSLLSSPLKIEASNVELSVKVDGDIRTSDNTRKSVELEFQEEQTGIIERLAMRILKSINIVLRNVSVCIVNGNRGASVPRLMLSVSEATIMKNGAQSIDIPDAMSISVGLRHLFVEFVVSKEGKEDVFYPLLSTSRDLIHTVDIHHVGNHSRFQETLEVNAKFGGIFCGVSSESLSLISEFMNSFVNSGVIAPQMYEVERSICDRLLSESFHVVATEISEDMMSEEEEWFDVEGDDLENSDEFKDVESSSCAFHVMLSMEETVCAIHDSDNGFSLHREVLRDGSIVFPLVDGLMSWDLVNLSVDFGMLGMDSTIEGSLENFDIFLTENNESRNSIRVVSCENNPSFSFSLLQKRNETEVNCDLGSIVVHCPLSKLDHIVNIVRLWKLWSYEGRKDLIFEDETERNMETNMSLTIPFLRFSMESEFRVHSLCLEATRAFIHPETSIFDFSVNLLSLSQRSAGDRDESELVKCVASQFDNAAVELSIKGGSSQELNFRFSDVDSRFRRADYLSLMNLVRLLTRIPDSEDIHIGEAIPLCLREPSLHESVESTLSMLSINIQMSRSRILLSDSPHEVEKGMELLILGGNVQVNLKDEMSKVIVHSERVRMREQEGNQYTDILRSSNEISVNPGKEAEGKSHDPVVLSYQWGFRGDDIDRVAVSYLSVILRGIYLDHFVRNIGEDWLTRLISFFEPSSQVSNETKSTLSIEVKGYGLAMSYRPSNAALKSSSIILFSGATYSTFLSTAVDDVTHRIRLKTASVFVHNDSKVDVLKEREDFSQDTRSAIGFSEYMTNEIHYVPVMNVYNVDISVESCNAISETKIAPLNFSCLGGRIVFKSCSDSFFEFVDILGNWIIGYDLYVSKSYHELISGSTKSEDGMASMLDIVLSSDIRSRRGYGQSVSSEPKCRIKKPLGGTVVDGYVKLSPKEDVTPVEIAATMGGGKAVRLPCDSDTDDDQMFVDLLGDSASEEGSVRIADPSEDYFRIVRENARSVSSFKSSDSPVGGYYTANASGELLLEYVNRDGNQLKRSLSQRLSHPSEPICDPVVSLKLKNVELIWTLIGGVDFSGSMVSDEPLNGPDEKTVVDISLRNVAVSSLFFGENCPCRARVAVSARDFEVVDRLQSSSRNKIIAFWKHDSRPRETDSDMLTVEWEVSRLGSSAILQENIISFDVLPLRVNMDQDALEFLLAFFCRTVSPSLMEVSSAYSHDGEVLVVPYFKRFETESDISVKIDYNPKRVNLVQLKNGNLVELLNFFPLQGVELVLRRHSVRGVDGFVQVVEEFANVWIPDIRRSQLHKCIAGVPPFRSLMQVGHGAADLFVMPFDQYRRNRRLARGLSKGAASFVKSLTVEVADLTADVASGTQVLMEQAGEIFLPQERAGQYLSKRAGQPASVAEGFTQAYDSLKRGMSNAVQTILAVPLEQKKGRTAVGCIVRAVPVALLAPVISLSEAVAKTAWGVRNTLDPSRREDVRDLYKDEDLHGNEKDEKEKPEE